MRRICLLGLFAILSFNVGAQGVLDRYNLSSANGSQSGTSQAGLATGNDAGFSTDGHTLSNANQAGQSATTDPLPAGTGAAPFSSGAALADHPLQVPALIPSGGALGQGGQPATGRQSAASIAGNPLPIYSSPTQRADYAANAASNMFGAQLFTGAFSNGNGVRFNGDYPISVGDQIRLRLWGGYEFDGVLTVDAQGAIFLPHAGPLKVAGIPNRDLQSAVTGALRRVFSNRVSIYVDLLQAQPVRVYVSGFVRHPGMYDGTSNDSVLRFLDQAGGVDPDRGSFLDVQVKRGTEVRAKLSLYDFLLKGELPSVPLVDGDVIVVGPRHSTVSVQGTAGGPQLFEFLGKSTTLAQIEAAARPDATVTNVRITRMAGSTVNVDYYPISDSHSVTLEDGDEVTFTADKQPGTITVRVEGEHLGPREYVLPYGTRLGALLSRVQMTERSDADDVQLFRASVKQRQKLLLQTSLQHLESAVLTARSGTEEEARLRKEEAALTLQWVARARQIDPTGQTVVGSGAIRDALPLENGDVLRVPARDGLVIIGGEVLFPTTIAANDRYSVGDYIDQAGGFSQSADSSRIVVAHLNGTFSDGAKNRSVVAGDQIIVLPKVDFKTRQFAKDIFQILYQIAISAKVALGL